MRDFEYQSPSTIEEAVGILTEHGDNASILAGGTDIIVQLREGMRKAEVVVDVKKIPQLTNIEWRDDGGLELGASVSCTQIYGDREIIDAYPALSDSARIIGGWQIQSRASIGGNLCNSSPAADSIPSLIVEGVTCRIAGPDGQREVPVSEFCTAPGKNCLGNGEFLVGLSFPAPVARSGSRYIRFIPRNEMDIAVVGAGTWLQLDEGGEGIEAARISLAAVAPTPLSADEAGAWLAGKPATEETFAAAGELASKIATPISDLRGPADYRVHLTGVIVKRSLTGAAGRARGGDRNPVIPLGLKRC